ncbi:MAG: hypothetical protein MJ221_01695 [Bacilli bacterium]|nr:hypothetical protein [Bacilli bacterium]
MKNKISALLLLPLVMGAVTSCSINSHQSANEGDNVLTKEILKANTVKYDEFYHYNLSFKTITVSGTDYSAVSKSKITVGHSDFVKLTYADGEVALFSVFKGEIVLPKKNWSNVGVVTNAYTSSNGLIFGLIQDTEGKTTEAHYFDGNGNEVWKNGDGEIVQYVQTEMSLNRNESVIVNMFMYMDEGSAPHIKFQVYENDVVAKTYVDQLPTGEKYVQTEGQPYDMTVVLSGTLLPLEDVGLKGYYLAPLSTKWYVYNEKFEVVNSYTIPSGMDFYSMAFLDGVAIMQKSVQVESHYANPSYFVGTNRYALETYKVDILSGEVTPLDVNYVLQMSDSKCEPLYNSKGEYIKYSVEKVRLISKTGSLDSTDTYWVIDGDGKLHNNMSSAPSLYRLIQWGNYYLEYDSSAYQVYDENLVPYTFLQNAQILENTKYLVFTDKNGQSGLIDQNLTVVSKGRFVPSSILGIGEANTFFAYTPDGIGGFYEIKDNSVSEKKVWDLTKVYDFDFAGYALYVQETETSDIKYYNCLNGEEVTLSSIPTGFTPDSGISATAISDMKMASGSYGIDAANNFIAVLQEVSLEGLVK